MLWLSRAAWFLAIWVGSVLALWAVAMVIRLFIA